MAIMPWRIESAPSDGPDRALLEDRDRRRQRARAQHDGEVARLLDRELPGDDGAAARDPLVDARRRVDVAVEDDGELPADVLLGDLAEDRCAPSALNSMATCQLPVRVRIRLHLGAVSSAPVSSARFCTTKGILRSAFVSLSTRRW